MSLYPARRASLLPHLPHDERRRYPNTDDNDKDNDRDPVLHLLHPRYTCGLTDTDCGNGYCCSTAHECVLPSSSTGETLCRLPGFSTANAVASLASDATGSVTTSGTATATSASATACSGNDCVVVSNGGISGSSSTTSNTSTSGSSSLSAGAIAGIVVGVVVALAAVVGAIVFLLCVRRKRRRNGGVRNAAVAATPSVTETGRGPPAYQRVPGGGGGGDGGPVDMYAGSNVGKMQGGVPGRVEVLGDTVQRPMVQELPGNEGVRPVEMDAGVEKK